MGWIYHHAESVIAWVGPRSAESDFVYAIYSGKLEVTKEMITTIRQLEMYRPFELLAKRRSLEFHPNWTQEPTILEEVIALALAQLSRYPWFTRTWVIQEAVLAKSLSLQFGTSDVPFEFLSAILAFLLPLVRNVFPTLLQVFGTIRGIDSQRQNIQRQDQFAQPTSMKLSNIIPIFKVYWNVKDDRDLVYGFLGMLKPQRLFAVEVPNRRASCYTVDYAASVESVYSDAVISMIADEHCLDILFERCGRKRKEKYDLRSWALNPRAMRCGTVSLAFRENTPIDQLQQTWAASGSTLPVVRYLRDSDDLVVKGVPIDLVLKVFVYSQDAPFQPKANPGLLLLAQMIKFCLETTTADGNNEVSRLEALWELLLFHGAFEDDLDDKRTAFLEMSRLIQNGESCQHCSQRESTRGLGGSSDGWHPSIVEDESESTSVPTGEGSCCTFARLRFTLPADSFMTGRALFFTQRGFLGSSCQHVQKGDVVCLLYGGVNPFLLREATTDMPRQCSSGQTNKRWTFGGGTCVISGLMQGQGMEIAETEQLTDCDFW